MSMDIGMGQRIRRAWRHLGSSNGDARRAFPEPTLAAISAAITAGEQTHRGEVRLIVEKALPFDEAWDGVSNRQRALALFADYGVWDTEDNCGVLIYINLAEHKVDIVADRGIDRKIDSSTWQAVCRTMTEGFRAGQFHDATLAAIGQVNALLQQHFPADGARANELPDQPLML
ncbi:TPM domain-containing protein [Massilia yuzhufengensis]|uniref:TLP18.3, Psb32 and MOLO-1 founding protein of phosphatase n=1 Tax=Massilia yuzhufengensis TaxID=1164594 RepID=A0A1I1THC3_9BURK|nr:TPM domain-containing protein [Massilia yuzhufengensis]SFD58006.1 TLP18.3, Psb32 and MOLO-1 founding protein of phosphatase [Massilia yuzhufengensis]